MANAGSFHFELETVVTISAGGFEADVPLSFVGDYRAPNSVQGKAVMSQGTFDVESDIVIIGDTIYATNPETGEWGGELQSRTPHAEPAGFRGG